MTIKKLLKGNQQYLSNRFRFSEKNVEKRLKDKSSCRQGKINKNLNKLKKT